MFVFVTFVFDHVCLWGGVGCLCVLLVHSRRPTQVQQHEQDRLQSYGAFATFA
jgi:hypothetical protein